MSDDRLCHLAYELVEAEADDDRNSGRAALLALESQEDVSMVLLEVANIAVALVDAITEFTGLSAAELLTDMRAAELAR